MNYDVFLDEWNGQQVTAYGGECVALAAQYCAENNKPIAWANAKDWFNNPSLTGAFDFTQNDPSDPNQLPTRGDIIIWSGDLPGSGGFGHIAIWDMKTPTGFQAFGQNWGGHEAHFQQHSWSYVLGWATPKPVAPTPDSHPDPAPANPEPTPVEPSTAEIPRAPEPTPAPAPAPEVPVVSEPETRPQPVNTNNQNTSTASPSTRRATGLWHSLFDGLIVWLTKLLGIK